MAQLNQPIAMPRPDMQVKPEIDLVDIDEDQVDSEPEGEPQYEVERILFHRRTKNRKTGGTDLKFKVKWKGYDETTWEPEENLVGCDIILNAYKSTHLSGDQENSGAKPGRNSSRSRGGSQTPQADLSGKPSRSGSARPKRAAAPAADSLKERQIVVGEVPSGPTPNKVNSTAVAKVIDVKPQGSNGKKFGVVVKLRNGRTEMISKEEAKKMCPEQLIDFMFGRAQFELSVHL